MRGYSPNIATALEDHLTSYVGASPGAWLFPGEDGWPVSPRTIDRVWHDARASIGRRELRFHDLRHTGLTWAAATGAGTAELMRRAGHKSATAALRYQHATDDRDRLLADALGQLASGEIISLRRTIDGRSSQENVPGALTQTADQEEMLT